MGLNDWSRAMLLTSHPTNSPIFSGGASLAPFIPPPPLPHQDSPSPSPPNNTNPNNHLNHPNQQPNQQPNHTAKDGGVYRSGRYCSYSCVVTDNGDETRVHRPFSRPNALSASRWHNRWAFQKSCWASGLRTGNPGPSAPI
ncbi:hypothetical protein NPIL_361451 [Nephila pilipes]|uniref:Uncharacterized protein n=1 Tax=Nephila pilipes TaxID=299642 RepID=A0A8X6UB32_NEPPI|nr:hypothetical protein NPIL_361451 [Nephila pilipes]